jgi:hypothetical protein
VSDPNRTEPISDRRRNEIEATSNRIRPKYRTHAKSNAGQHLGPRQGRFGATLIQARDNGAKHTQWHPYNLGPAGANLEPSTGCEASLLNAMRGPQKHSQKVAKTNGDLALAPQSQIKSERRIRPIGHHCRSDRHRG